ncbi:MAG: hypothetical protein QOI82_2392 [Actinomycetota bacterium]|jgi:hypothetical protein|nr:hypothetical protein [Actinomycetota bacterium]
MKARLLLLVCLLAAGCGGGSGTVTTVAAPPSPSASVAATPSESPSRLPTSSPIPPTAPGPHFRTPQAAMRYLARAWNQHDEAALRHVTDPSARSALEDMRTEAVNLRLSYCVRQKAGDYECFFRHDFPKGYTGKERRGIAQFVVGPATRPGWYMTVLESCG